MTLLPNAQLTHVGLFVRNLQVMTDFYCRMLGMVVTDSGPFGGRELAFLSRSPDEHHQLVMIHDPSRTECASALSQISFRLENLEALRTFYAFLAEEKASDLEGRNHGNSWSLYFFDPERNKIEIYVPTPWQLSQPWRAPLDLTKTADAIVAETERLVSQNPTTQPAEQWSRAMARRMGFASTVNEEA
ncbi:VOC family protein [Comamonadaceae bacterium G21597-S1]|nr:VOC family protein [Comamonadaceae bacterium G21597-S1]